MAAAGQDNCRAPIEHTLDEPPFAHRLHAALTARGVPARLGNTVEGHPVAVAVTGRSGEQVDIEIDESPG